MKSTVAFLFVLLSLIWFSCDNPSSSDKQNPFTPPEWTTIDLGSVTPVRLFPHPTAGDVLFLEGHNGERNLFLKSVDCGLIWDTLFTDIESTDVLSVAFFGPGPDKMFVLGNYQEEEGGYFRSRLFASEDGGLTWGLRGENDLATPSSIWVDPLDIDHLWLSWGSMSVICGFAESHDGGLTWTDVRTDFFADQSRRVWEMAFEADDLSIMYVNAGDVDGHGALLRTEDNFESWTVLREREGAAFYFELDPRKSDQMLIVEKSGSSGDNDVIYLSDDGGVAWREVADPVDNQEDKVEIDGVAWIGDSVYVSVDEVVWVLAVNSEMWVFNRDFSSNMSQAGLRSGADNSLYLYGLEYNGIHVYH